MSDDVENVENGKHSPRRLPNTGPCGSGKNGGCPAKTPPPTSNTPGSARSRPLSVAWRDGQGPPAPDRCVSPARSERSLHSLSYSAHTAGMDRSEISVGLTMEPLFPKEDATDRDGTIKVSYFAKACLSDIKELIFKPVAENSALKEIWAGSNRNWYHPACCPPRLPPAARCTRLLYLRAALEGARLHAGCDGGRRAALAAATDLSRQAKTAILAGAGRDPHGEAFGYPTEETSVTARSAALAAADGAIARKHEWSVLADARLSVTYAQLSSMESILFLKQTLRLFDTEMISFQKSVAALLRTGCPRVEVDGRQCPRHQVSQFHKRRLFRNLKKIHRGQMDLSELCMEFSVEMSCVEALWLAGGVSVYSATCYVMEVLDAAAQKDTEDAWAGACVLLQSLDVAMQARDSEPAYSQAHVDVKLYLEFAAAMLEYAFCKKLLVRACGGQLAQYWGAFKYHFDVVSSQWQALSEALARARRSCGSTRPSPRALAAIEGHVSAALRVMAEWDVCVRVCISQSAIADIGSRKNNIEEGLPGDICHYEYNAAIESLMEAIHAACALSASRQGHGAESDPEEDSVVFSEGETRELVCLLFSQLSDIVDGYSNALQTQAKIASAAVRANAQELPEPASAAVAAFRESAQRHAELRAGVEGLGDTIAAAGGISSESYGKLRAKLISVETHSKEQAMCYSFIPRELAAYSLFERLRKVTVLRNAIKTQLRRYCELSELKLSLSDWCQVLSQAEKAMLQMSSVVLELRNTHVQQGLFKTSPLSCSCCTGDEISHYMNCKCRVVPFCIQDLIEFLDNYAVKTTSDRAKARCDPQTLQQENVQLSTYWGHLEKMCLSVADNRSVALIVGDASPLLPAIHARLQGCDAAAAVLVRRRKAGRTARAVAGAAAIFFVGATIFTGYDDINIITT